MDARGCNPLTPPRIGGHGLARSIGTEHEACSIVISAGRVKASRLCGVSTRRCDRFDEPRSLKRRVTPGNDCSSRFWTVAPTLRRQPRSRHRCERAKVWRRSTCNEIDAGGNRTRRAPRPSGARDGNGPESDEAGHRHTARTLGHPGPRRGPRHRRQPLNVASAALSVALGRITAAHFTGSAR